MTTTLKSVSANPWQGGTMTQNIQTQSTFLSNVAALQVDPCLDSIGRLHVLIDHRVQFMP